MRPTLRQLECLVAVDEAGQFGLAAKRLALSQPSLSAQVKSAEDELGLTVFERGRAGARATPLGAEIIRRARRILREVTEMKDAAQMAAGDLAGRMKLGVLASVGPYLMPRAVKELHAEFTDLRLVVSEHLTPELDARLRSGALDVIISTPEDHEGLDAMPILDERLWISCAPDHTAAASRAAFTSEALEGEDLLTLGAGQCLHRIVEALAATHGARVSRDYSGTSLDAVRQMASMGAGLAVLPTLYAVAEARRDPDLPIRPLAGDGPVRSIALIWRPGSPLAASFQMLGLILRDTAQDILEEAGLLLA